MFAGIIDKRGGIAMEFALVLPVLLVVLLGIIQFGYAFFVQTNMNNAAREAARELAVGSATVGGATDCASAAAGTAEAVACENLIGLAASSFTLAACDPDNPNATLCPGADDVTMRVSIPRTQIAMGDILGFFDAGNMVALITMRKEDS